MTTAEKDEAVLQIEALIDKTSLSSVLNAIAGICYAKGIHLRTNWQDHSSANGWCKAGNAIEGLATRLTREWYAL